MSQEPEQQQRSEEAGLPPSDETPKVQPKKETVRISLPPKPKSAPTIKIVRPTAGAQLQQATEVKEQVAEQQPKQEAPAVTPTSPPSIGQRPTGLDQSIAATRPRPVVVGQPASVQPTTSALDLGLAIVAGVLGLLAVLRILFLPGVLS